MEKFVPRAANRALLVGVVNDDEFKILQSKGYTVTKADLMPRNPSILKLDLTAPPPELRGQFNLVVASDVLEHIPDDRAAVRGIYDLLADGGLAYLHTPGGDINAPLDDEDRRHGHARQATTSRRSSRSLTAFRSRRFNITGRSTRRSGGRSICR
jgi:SAM-dependent methyltransferase